MFERRPFVFPIRQRPRPLHAQIVHVFLGNFLQRTEPLVVVGAPPKQPVPGRRILQQLIGYRREFLEWIRQDHRLHRRSQRRKRHHHPCALCPPTRNLHQRERLRICRQFAPPRLHSVHLEHVGNDLGGGLRAKLARARGRHLRVDVREKLHRRLPAPIVAERHPVQRAGKLAATKRLPMATSTALRINSLALLGLRRCVRRNRPAAEFLRANRRHKCDRDQERSNPQKYSAMLHSRPQRHVIIATNSGNPSRPLAARIEPLFTFEN